MEGAAAGRARRVESARDAGPAIAASRGHGEQMMRSLSASVARAAKRVFATAALAVGLAAAAPASANPEVVDKISAYLNGVSTMSGDFVQIAPDTQVTEGSFVMRRPGRIAFTYAPPSVTRVVADGFWVAVVDESSRLAPDRYPLSETPLSLLLKRDVDLRDEEAIQLVELREGKYWITAVDPSGDAEGSITMVFDVEPLKLSQWIVVDGQGFETSVVLRNVQRDVEVNMADFLIPDGPGRFAD